MAVFHSFFHSQRQKFALLSISCSILFLKSQIPCVWEKVKRIGCRKKPRALEFRGLASWATLKTIQSVE